MSSTIRKTPPPRFWPLYVLVTMQAVALALSFNPDLSDETRFYFLAIAPLATLGLTGLWLLVLSRLRWSERLLLPLGCAVLAGPALLVVDDGVWIIMWLYGLPLMLLLGVVGLRASAAGSVRRRYITTLGLVALGWASFTLVRVEGFTGSFVASVKWRWAPTSEELAANRIASPATESSIEQVTVDPTDWPGFRGAARISSIGDVTLASWASSPPEELWRVPVGPAWSSFAHVGGLLLTQEQRGDEEVVSCYEATTGTPVWTYTYLARFEELVSGAGPRATPTFADGHIFAFGAQGHLACLDARTGEPIWSRELTDELGATVPTWGCSSSPFVVGDRVIVYVDGIDGHGLVAFDASSGEVHWKVDASGQNYGSAQPATIHGVELVLFLSNRGLLALDAETGSELWSIKPSGWRGTPIVQPQHIGEGRLVFAIGDGAGIARVDARLDEGEWVLEEKWSSKRMKPDFNDFVYHDGAIFGFDKSALTCLDVETGGMVWRRRGYGFGQVLLAGNDLVVVTESGDVVQLPARREQLEETGRIRGVDGKTWNHPVIAGDMLFVRNGAEAAAFKLSSPEQ